MFPVNDLTVLIVTFKTNHKILDDCIKSIDGKSKIIIVENSNDEEFKKWVVAKWSIAPERKMKKYGHPAMFPEELVRRGLKLFSFKNDLILDPFNGVGTTTKVAHTMNRNYLGIDNAKKYCNIKL